MSQEFTFPKGSKPKSFSDPYEDSFAQEYFKEPTVNFYLKKLLGFTDKSHLTNGDISKLKESYDKAHDIRKFEIELYWKRTAYLWTLIAALITICGVLATAYYRMNEPGDPKSILLFIMAGISTVGVIFTIISSYIIKSGAYWQKNWEYHVNLLEPFFSGKLYATLLNRERTRYSIASLNSTIYWFTLLAWLILFGGFFVSFTIDLSYSRFFKILAIIIISILLIDRIIGWVARRKSEISKININQWGVEIPSPHPENDKKANDKERKKLTFRAIHNILKTIIYLLVIWILAIIVFNHYN